MVIQTPKSKKMIYYQQRHIEINFVIVACITLPIKRVDINILYPLSVTGGSKCTAFVAKYLHHYIYLQ